MDEKAPCYIAWCQRGHHAGSHSLEPYVPPPVACAPLRCYCGKCNIRQSAT